MMGQRQHLVLLIFSLVLLFQTSNAHNITLLIAKHPSLSKFNHYLTLTHLAPEINRRTTITVLALENDAMSSLLAKNPSMYTVKNILSLHVLLDYFGARKLHQISNGTALAATMFQATGVAPGNSGFVNITDFKGGKVGFGAEDNGGNLDSFFVKSVEELPYNISVIQINKALPSAVAEAPAPGPNELNITDIMSAHGCKVFADTLLANPEAMGTYEENVNGGLTVFCPLDDPLYQSMSMLRSNNGLMNTLATDGASNYDFTVQNEGEDVTLKTRISTVKITGTLLDEGPVAIYTINKVLMPKELFKASALSPAPAPAPGPEEAADSPKVSKSKSKSKAAPTADADSPADSPDNDPDDQVADDENAGTILGADRFAAAAVLSCLFVFFLL
ncbi:Fasciclin-like arabinogalactan protein 1 [Hibiscus syriacus]|uniref:Fasciclin-like arabinogalactan protein 1 n=1 Tax=Hibiscus syriacus TaxID=106335 RepID=A0A6A2WBE0_HIBSY|nr:Fasciclin-like arabinogalactan protein 1 [Hibiscus syriacus]